MGNQTRPGSKENTPKSEDFFWKVIGSFSVPFAIAALPRRCFLMTSIRNQQRLIEKWDDSDFEEHAH